MTIHANKADQNKNVHENVLLFLPGIYKYNPRDYGCTKCQCLRNQLSHVWVERSVSAVITLSVVTEANSEEISITEGTQTWLHSGLLSVEPRCFLYISHTSQLQCTCLWGISFFSLLCFNYSEDFCKLKKKTEACQKQKFL